MIPLSKAIVYVSGSLQAEEVIEVTLWCRDKCGHMYATAD